MKTFFEYATSKLIYQNYLFKNHASGLDFHVTTFSSTMSSDVWGSWEENIIEIMFFTFIWLWYKQLKKQFAIVAKNINIIWEHFIPHFF